MIRKITDYKGLKDIGVYIEDTRNEYIQVFDVPNIIGEGKHSFLIDVNPGTLEKDTQLLVELLDVNGDPIYTEVPKYREGRLRRVSIFVYDDTINGVANLTIVGVAKNVPNDWIETYNVRYTTNIVINKPLRNTSAIRFYNDPTMEISEKRVTYLSRSFVDGETTNIISGSKLDGLWSDKVKQYQLTFGDTELIYNMEGGTLTVPDLSYTAKIDNIITTASAYTKTPYYSSDAESQIITNFKAQEYTMSYENVPTYHAATNYKSYANIDLGNIRTFSGEVYRVKTYLKSQGALGHSDYTLLNDSVVDGKELLIDTGSLAESTRTGYFYSQTTIDNWWNGSLSLKHNSGKYIDAMYFESPSFNHISYVSQLPVSADGEYRLTFSLYGIPITENQKFEIYMSGSGFGDNKFGSGKLIYSNTSIDTINEKNISIPFVADVDGSGSIRIEAQGGNYHVSNVSLKVDQEMGFSPDRYNLIVPMPTFETDDVLNFKTEFFDSNNNMAPFISNVENIRFTGSTIPGEFDPPLTVYLTLPSFVAPASSVGEVDSWANSSGSMIATVEKVNVSTDSTYNVLGSSSLGVLGSIGLHTGDYNGSLIEALDSGTLTFGVEYSGSNATMSYNMAKAVAGATGSKGETLLSAYLTKQSFVVSAETDGEVINWDLSSGSFIVMYGLENVSTEATYSLLGSSSLDVTAYIGPDGVYNANLATGEDTGSVDYGVEYSGSSITMSYNIAKARTGIKGIDGTGANALQIKLSGDTQIFTFYDGTNTYYGNDTGSFTSSKQNITGSTTWSFSDDNKAPVDTAFWWTGSEAIDENATRYGELYVEAFGPDTQSIFLTVEANGYSDSYSIVKLYTGEIGPSGSLDTASIDAKIWATSSFVSQEMSSSLSSSIELWADEKGTYSTTVLTKDIIGDYTQSLSSSLSESIELWADEKGTYSTTDLTKGIIGDYTQSLSESLSSSIELWADEKGTYSTTDFTKGIIGDYTASLSSSLTESIDLWATEKDDYYTTTSVDTRIEETASTKAGEFTASLKDDQSWNDWTVVSASWKETTQSLLLDIVDIKTTTTSLEKKTIYLDNDGDYSGSHVSGSIAGGWNIQENSISKFTGNDYGVALVVRPDQAVIYVGSGSLSDWVPGVRSTTSTNRQYMTLDAVASTFSFFKSGSSCSEPTILMDDNMMIGPVGDEKPYSGIKLKDSYLIITGSSGIIWADEANPDYIINMDVIDGHYRVHADGFPFSITGSEVEMTKVSIDDGDTLWPGTEKLYVNGDTFIDGTISASGDMYCDSIYTNSSSVHIGAVTMSNTPSGSLKINTAMQIGTLDVTATANADNAGTLRYWETGDVAAGTSQLQICMKTSGINYAWVSIKYYDWGV